MALLPDNPIPQTVFPLRIDYAYVSAGLTLRDYFAGQALIGAMMESGTDTVGTEADQIAQWCYVIADAMVKAREQA